MLAPAFSVVPATQISQDTKNMSWISSAVHVNRSLKETHSLWKLQCSGHLLPGFKDDTTIYALH